MNQVLSALQFLVLMTSFAHVASSRQPQDFQTWTAGASPQEVGKRVSGRFLNTLHLLSREQEKEPYIAYPESVTWYGALTFAKLA